MRRGRIRRAGRALSAPSPSSHAARRLFARFNGSSNLKSGHVNLSIVSPWETETSSVRLPPSPRTLGPVGPPGAQPRPQLWRRGYLVSWTCRRLVLDSLTVFKAHRPGTMLLSRPGTPEIAEAELPGGASREQLPPRSMEGSVNWVPNPAHYSPSETPLSRPVDPAPRPTHASISAAIRGPRMQRPDIQ